MNYNLYKHNDKFYQILRYLREHNVTDKNGNINMDMLAAWRDYVGADHVLRDGNGFMLCRTVQDVDPIELEVNAGEEITVATDNNPA
jgi:hypothetical protein